MEVKIKSCTLVSKDNLYLTDDDIDRETNIIGVAIGDRTIDVKLDELLGAVAAFATKRDQILERRSYD